MIILPDYKTLVLGYLEICNNLLHEYKLSQNSYGFMYKGVMRVDTTPPQAMPLAIARLTSFHTHPFFKYSSRANTGAQNQSFMCNWAWAKFAEIIIHSIHGVKRGERGGC